MSRDSRWGFHLGVWGLSAISDVKLRRVGWYGQAVPTLLSCLAEPMFDKPFSLNAEDLARKLRSSFGISTGR